MENALIKMARKLRALDEASLMDLWEKYAAQVDDFEPTPRWEEAVIVLGIIQSMRFKNQLFNYHWALTGRPDQEPAISPDPGSRAHEAEPGSESGPGGGKSGGKGGKVLSFRPRKNG